LHDVSINGTNYLLTYNIRGEPYGDPEGVKLVNIIANTGLKALSVQIESNQNGSFRIELPWALITNIGLDRNADFVVIVDGEQVSRAIATSPESVILGFEFQQGTKEILIGDSRVIPEFSSMVIILAAIAVLGTVASLRFMSVKH
jgi:hypothetical protein